jgi:urease accessory protein
MPARHMRRAKGRVELVFARSGTATQLSHAHACGPLKIVRPFGLDGGRQLVQILTIGPGICGDDEYAIDVVVETGARAVVVSQSATRVHRMKPGSRAVQSVTLTVEDGGQLEYYPGPTIPYPDSDLSQTVTVSLDGASRFGLLECWAMGRVARGEYLVFRCLSSRTEVRVDDMPTYSDALHLEPGRVDVAAAGVLEHHRYVASGYWYGAPGLQPSALQTDRGVLCALGESTPGQVYLRALAMDGPALGAALGGAVDQVYRSWNLREAPILRFAS